jgi:LL-diaminopimelate aminotransferase
MDIIPAERLDGIGAYFFAQRGEHIARLRSQGVDIIRMDIGSPDMPPAEYIIEAMVNSARDSAHHGYTPAGGTPEFRAAVCDHYQARYGVELDVETEVLGLIGSKEGVFHLTQAILNPGDLAIIPDPGYLVYPRAARIAGAELVRMPLLERLGYLPELASLPGSTPGRKKMLWLNYPNNPTGAAAGYDFFTEVIDYARENEVLVCHDAPYLEVVYDGLCPPSIMQVPGAKEVAVEFNSLSKTYNMAGWRLGMAVGNAKALKALYRYKSQVDSSHFRPLMDAGVAALQGDQDWVRGRNQIYQERLELVLGVLQQIGVRARRPGGALYVWAKLPGEEIASIPYTTELLEATGVSFSPGAIFGEQGEGHMRISLTASRERIGTALERYVEWHERRRAGR